MIVYHEKSLEYRIWASTTYYARNRRAFSSEKEKADKKREIQSSKSVYIQAERNLAEKKLSVSEKQNRL